LVGAAVYRPPPPVKHETVYLTNSQAQEKGKEKSKERREKQLIGTYQTTAKARLDNIHVMRKEHIPLKTDIRNSPRT